MKFTSAFTVTLLALAKLIVADSESFGLVSIRSGSNLQYASVYVNNDKLYVGSSSDALSAVVTDAGKLKFNGNDSTFAVVNSDGTISEGSEADATDKFSIKDGHLVYNNVDGFYAIPDGSSYIFSTQSGDNSVGIAIRATASSGQTVPDFSPSGSDSSSSSEASSSTSSEVSSGTTTVAPTETTSEAATETSTEVQTQASSTAAISQISDGQVQAIQTENGAPKAALGMGAGIAAAAAALLL